MKTTSLRCSQCLNIGDVVEIQGAGSESYKFFCCKTCAAEIERLKECNEAKPTKKNRSIKKCKSM